jgi:hypothetical protein
MYPRNRRYSNQFNPSNPNNGQNPDYSNYDFNGRQQNTGYYNPYNSFQNIPTGSNQNQNQRIYNENGIRNAVGYTQKSSQRDDFKEYQEYQDFNQNQNPNLNSNSINHLEQKIIEDRQKRQSASSFNSVNQQNHQRTILPRSVPVNTVDAVNKMENFKRKVNPSNFEKSSDYNSNTSSSTVVPVTIFSHKYNVNDGLKNLKNQNNRPVQIEVIANNSHQNNQNFQQEVSENDIYASFKNQENPNNPIKRKVAFSDSKTKTAGFNSNYLKLAKPNQFVNPIKNSNTHFVTKNSLVPARNSMIYTEDFGSPLDLEKIKKERTRKKIKQILKKEKAKAKSGIMIKLLLASVFITFSVSGLFFWNNFNSSLNSGGQVAGASEINEKYSDYEEYKVWIQEKANGYFSPEEDKDEDGLTNYEEFLIGSNPTSKNTCDEKVTDMENLLALKNPASCELINLENSKELEIFSKIIDFEMVKENFIENEKVEPVEGETGAVNTQKNLLEVFNVASYNELDAVDDQAIADARATLDKKKEYLNLIQKVDQYVKKYRSFEAYDRNYKEPVHPATYLQVSLEYDVPLKYVLAVARKESRFGTDRYDASGNLTRPGKYQNIYSIGLDDSGNNTTYESWEEGVKGFGRWYQSFEQRGVEDCRKWRIYNPNGDYCQVIENLASEIQLFLES